MNLDNLTFVKLRFPRCIPRELIESVKGITFTPEKFYDYLEEALPSDSEFLYVLVDDDKRIHGYIWFQVNILDNSIFLNTYSVSKEYWGKGEAIKKAVEFMKKIKDELKASEIYWCTSNSKYFAKHGFRPAKQTLMVYQ